MPLLQIRQSRGLVRQLTRIADALEEILRLQYGYSLQAPKADTSGVDPELFYTDQEKIDALETLDKVGVTPEEQRRQLEQIRAEITKGKL